jgi:hypothetical protein
MPSQARQGAKGPRERSTLKGTPPARLSEPNDTCTARRQDQPYFGVDVYSILPMSHYEFSQSLEPLPPKNLSFFSPKFLPTPSLTPTSCAHSKPCTTNTNCYYSALAHWRPRHHGSTSQLQIRSPRLLPDLTKSFDRRPTALHCTEAELPTPYTSYALPSPLHPRINSVAGLEVELRDLVGAPLRAIQAI